MQTIKLTIELTAKELGGVLECLEQRLRRNLFDKLSSTGLALLDDQGNKVGKLSKKMNVATAALDGSKATGVTRPNESAQVAREILPSMPANPILKIPPAPATLFDASGPQAIVKATEKDFEPMAPF